MTVLTAASRQWATRPNDQRFTSLTTLLDRVRAERGNSVSKTVSTRVFEVQPVGEDHKGLQIVGQNGTPASMTHYSFGQLAGLAGAPAGYLRTLPSEIAADNINYGLRFNRAAEDVKVLLTKDVSDEQVRVDLRAATGPNYGRIWNDDIVENAVRMFGDGTREGGGRWQVPGEFRRQVPITVANTTLFAGDRDMFIFLADEQNGVQINNRRNGSHGELARGFFLWNSEVGSTSMGIACFLYDYTCSNRMVWGVKEYKEIRLRHTVSAPDKWLEQVNPVIEAYAESSVAGIEQTIKNAQEAKIEGDLNAFLQKRFTKTEVTQIKEAHVREEGRPIETLWDAATGVTAAAKKIGHQNDRVAMERKAGLLLDLVAA